MPPILFPKSHAPGKDAVEGAGSLVNAYAEPLQEGGPSGHVIRRPPGLTQFAETDNSSFRGIWYDGSAKVYAAYSTTLSWFDEAGTETAIGGIPDGAVAYTGRYGSTTDTTSYSITSVAFGDADSDRRIVVGIAAMEYEGSDLVTNGAFTSNISNWTVSPSSTWQWDSGVASAGWFGGGPSPSSGTLSQSLTTVSGATYRVRVTPYTGSGTCTVKLGGTTLGTFAWSAGAQVFNVVVAGTSNTLEFIANSLSGAGGIDSVSVKRVQFALPTAVTIGGVSATSVAAATRAALWVANVPTGTSGTVALTYANTMNEAYIAVWRLGGVTSNTPTDTAATTASPGFADVSVPAGGVACFISQQGSAITWTAAGVSADMNAAINSGVGSTNRHSAFSGFSAASTTFSITSNAATASIAAAAWQGNILSLGNGFVTFAKDNASTPNQVFCAAGTASASFTSSAVGSALDVNSEITNSVCYGEGYFFFTTPDGLCYASNLNSTTVTATDYTRAEARAEPLVRGVYYRGELFLFGETHTEVYASNGNPNATGFPLNYTTSIWRGLLTTGAVCGFEEGFEGQLIWVADDYSVRQLSGYEAVPISPPDLERDIEACGSKSTIRCWVYDVDGHACVGVHLPGTATWVYDLSTGFWHTRKSLDAADCRLSGNTVRAFDKWIGGDTDSGDLLYLDDTVYTEVSDAMTFEVESIAMEAFPQRLQVSRADFNFVGGVGTTTTPDPMVKISWSDDGGHTWSDPVSRKLGEAGRYLEQVRVNRVGLTKHKGRRWRLQVSDEVYVSLLGGSMEVAGRP